jgi:hypothetical protein
VLNLIGKKTLGAGISGICNEVFEFEFMKIQTIPSQLSQFEPK